MSNNNKKVQETTRNPKQGKAHEGQKRVVSRPVTGEDRGQKRVKPQKSGKSK